MAIAPEFILAFEPNVDSLLVAGYPRRLLLPSRGTAAGGMGWGDLVLGSLAAGLGMGTKPTGIVFFPPLLLLVVAWDRRARAPPTPRCAGGSGRVLVPAVAMMAYWPIRNAWLTGNPLYPLHVEALGRVWLAAGSGRGR